MEKDLDVHGGHHYIILATLSLQRMAFGYAINKSLFHGDTTSGKVRLEISWSANSSTAHQPSYAAERKLAICPANCPIRKEQHVIDPLVIFQQILCHNLAVAIKSFLV